MNEQKRARLVGTLVLATAVAGVLYIGGIVLMMQCLLIMFVGLIVQALLRRNHRVLAALVMPSALFAIFPSKRVRSRLDEAKDHEEERESQMAGNRDASRRPSASGDDPS